MMKQLKKIIRWIIILLPMILAISGICYSWARQAAPEDAQYDRGKKLFNSDCRVCHVLKSEGDQPSPYYLRFRPGDFSDQDFWKNHSEGDIENAVRKGKGAMPAQPLGPEEIKDLVHFMKIEFKR